MGERRNLFDVDGVILLDLEVKHITGTLAGGRSGGEADDKGNGSLQEVNHLLREQRNDG